MLSVVCVFEPMLIFSFYPLVVSHYREPQLQVSENYSYLFSLRSNICIYHSVNTGLIPKNLFNMLIRRLRSDHTREGVISMNNCFTIVTYLMVVTAVCDTLFW